MSRISFQSQHMTRIARIFFSIIGLLLASHTVFAQSTGIIVDRINTKQKVVALTFDADMTPWMLTQMKKGRIKSWYNEKVIETLEREKVPATLFLTGLWVETYPEITRQLSANPLFEIGNHSYSHPAFSSPCYSLPSMSETNDSTEITKTDVLLSQHTKKYSKLFRFPGLCYDVDDIKTTTKLGYMVIGGDVFGNDGFQRNPQIITSHILSSVKPGSIVVLHMIGGPNAPRTSDALPTIIQRLRKDGYEFVTVSELLKM